MNTYNNIIIKNIKFSYGDHVVFKDLNCTFQASNINVILGKSGSGKTTLLKLLTDQLEYSSGEIDNVDVNDIAYLSQFNDLLPWYSMKKNITIALKIKNKSTVYANELINKFNLEKYQNSSVDQLSGGQIKRFALVRTFALDTPWIFLDEPFSNLDYFTRNDLYYFLLAMQKESNKSIILITHDIDEAILLANNVFILKDSRLHKVEIPFRKRDRNTIFTPEFLTLKQEILNSINN